MDVAMAPPPKRRKTESTSDSTSLHDNSTVLPENSPSFAQAVESLSTHSVLVPPWPTSSGHTEQATRIPLPAVGGTQDYNVLVARQGTLLNSVESAIDSVLSSVTSYASDISISASASLSGDLIPVGVSSTTTDTASSTSITTTATTTTTTNSTSSSSDISAASSTVPTPSSNGTSTFVTTSSSSTTGLTGFSANLTTSARTTSSRTPTDSGLYFYVTLSDGDVTAVSRHNNAYTTTLADGEVFTIPSISASSTRSSSRTSSSTETTSLSSSSNIELSTVTAIATVAVTPAGGTASYAAPTTSSTLSSSDGSGGNNDSTPPAGTIAGGVVGGAAGLAVVLLIAMLFVRWYRRKGQMGHQALSRGFMDSPDGDGAPVTSRGPGMAERAGLMPMMAALPAFFRHQNRSTEGLEPSERGFTRVSGRKLPSAFSEGMSSVGTRPPPPQMPLRSPGLDDNLRETSFYRDSDGFYGGAGEAARSISPASDGPIHGGSELIAMSPGPERQPQIHSGGPYTMSPASGDIPNATAATFDRSETHGRFTEDM